MGSAAADSGRLIVVVGPSGAGKDTLIDHARLALGDDPRVMFVRRVVTRRADESSEDHDTMSDADFATAEKAGAFAYTWRAHGLCYGLPAALSSHLADGGVAVANGSRAALPGLKKRFPELVTVLLTVRPDILAHRLAARGRESAVEIEARLRRAKDHAIDDADCIAIANDGAVEEAGGRLVELIRRLSAAAPPCA